MIGLAGLKGAGKNTAAQVLVDKLGYVEEALAAPLKRIAEILNPVLPGGGQLSDLLKYYTWDEVKQFLEVRQYLQILGKEAIRDQLGESVLIHALENRMNWEQDYVITDVRFPNEVEWVQMKGIVLWIDNPKCKPDGHSSENLQLIDRADYVVVNDGTIEDLHKKILDVVDNHVIAA